MNDETDEQEESELSRALDEAREVAETEWQETAITEKFEVAIPKENALDLRDSADATWGEDGPPRRHAEGPKYSLQQFVAERVAKDRFLERHEVKHTSNLDAHATAKGRTKIMRDGDQRMHGEVWEVVVYL